MNKVRRKALADIAAKLEYLKNALEDIQTEEENYRDNIPENMQGSERYKRAEEAISNIEDAVSNLEDAICSIEAAAE